MKIIIPMAGKGSRFADQGNPIPKPFIDVNGKPMIQRVVESLLLFEHEHVFIVRDEHLKHFDLHRIFPYIRFRTVPIYDVTEGAAISVAQAANLFSADEDVLIVNSDQLFHYNNSQVQEVRESDVDGCIWCFHGEGPKWSYAKVDDAGRVIEVAEKKQISQYATGGMYYWKSFRNYLDSVNRMIAANDRTNNEFYVAPAYNHMLPGTKTIIKMLDDIDQLGTPEDLQAYADKIRLY